MDIYVQALLRMYVFVSLGYIVVVELLGHMVISCLTFWAAAKLSSIAAAHCTSRPQCTRLLTLHTLPTLATFCFLGSYSAACFSLKASIIFWSWCLALLFLFLGKFFSHASAWFTRSSPLSLCSAVFTIKISHPLPERPVNVPLL